MTDLHSFYQAENYQVQSSVGYLVKQLAQTVGKELDRRMVNLGLHRRPMETTAAPRSPRRFGKVGPRCTTRN